MIFFGTIKLFIVLCVNAIEIFLTENRQCHHGSTFRKIRREIRQQ